MASFLFELDEAGLCVANNENLRIQQMNSIMRNHVEITEGELNWRMRKLKLQLALYLSQCPFWDYDASLWNTMERAR